MIAPALLRYAPALAEAFLPRFLAGEEAWAQAFSEPDAGSDLAALRTRGVLEGDRIVVDGQKVWTSHGHRATRLLVLVRTGPPESRHRGLAALLVDTRRSGSDPAPVDVRQRRAGDVRDLLPRCARPDRPHDRGSDRRVERRHVHAPVRTKHVRRTTPGLSRPAPASDPAIPRRSTARSSLRVPRCRPAWLLVQTVRARTIQTVRRLDAGETVGPEASADKILLARAEQAVFELARLAGRGHFVWDAAGEPWRNGWWYSRATSIFGGAGEIQRSIVADRILRLPTE